ncbi:Rpa1ap [Orobanche gracilis]
MPVNLMANAISEIIGSDVNSKPLVQVLDIKLVGSTQERYRLIISDSVEAQQAMLATQLNDQVRLDRVRKGSVVQLIEYICSTIQNRKIIVVLNMETIIPDCDVIGKPVGLTESDPVLQNPARDTTSGPIPSIKNNAGGAQNSARTNKAAIMRNEAPAVIIPIAALNPYQCRWAIKARVMAKGDGDLRRYNNARGDGKVFSFDLLDPDGGEIRVTCFNAVVDRFYETIEVGKVYVISKGNLKPAQKNFNHLKNEWEMFLEAASSVYLCPDEDSPIPRQQFSFRPISEIQSAESNSILDIVGIVVTVNPSLVDNGIFPILAVKSGKVNNFSGKSISTISATQLFINPDFPESNSLRDWFDGGGKDTASHSISKDFIPKGSRNDVRKSLAQIKDEGLGRSDKPDWITVKATISFIKTNAFCYTACPLMIGDRQCSKKVTKSGNSSWLRDRYNQEYGECDYRYLLQVQVQDHSGLTWVTAFQKTGEEILGCSAKELYMLKHEARDDIRFLEII